ncbi:putative 2-Oxobutyrate oxidase [Rhodovastum atsumiense]|uniref:2-oxoglutarate-dependent ethylene/succinate-forming enzyme n=1 Tax=Rhodovastum atsumiense TaxID=504468 RepID=A0A5M6IJX3_9PROT|nr:2-oxoglutarate and iron-dependent oxygenase domain-containing protein [Rhodovastum atsumiense]KAA5608563.1 isopenicillin N synthase family oxygenase [Rhodovastum atsumiense]CAH2598798.1 putative 2-Oxobutyrate oxidase [Rhodovastum atsumiense]
MTLPASSLPLLDLRHLDGGVEERTAFLDHLRGVARDFGFFYVTGHGIPDALVAGVLAEARRFFALPEADKLAIAMVNSPHFRGYNRAGQELTRGRPDWREQLDVGAEREALPRTSDAPAWTRLQGPNQWPAALPSLRPVLLQWQAEATALAIRMVRAFAAALGQPDDVFAPIYRDSPNQLLKIIRYPGRDAGADPGGDQGVGAHKDGGFVTVLLQDSVAGLQVETDAGWIDAPPRPGSFIINVGELLELASGGYLRANVHRVVSPPSGTDRLSVAFFLGARLDAVVPVLSLPPALAAAARGVTRDPGNPIFHDVGRNHLKGRLRSHPDVARRHHADLLAAFTEDGTLVAASAG